MNSPVDGRDMSSGYRLCQPPRGEQVWHVAHELVDHDNEKRNAIYASDVNDLDDGQAAVLGVTQEVPGEGEKGQIGARILQRHPQGRSSDNDPGSDTRTEQPVEIAKGKEIGRASC